MNVFLTCVLRRSNEKLANAPDLTLTLSPLIYPAHSRPPSGWSLEDHSIGITTFLHIISLNCFIPSRALWVARLPLRLVRHGRIVHTLKLSCAHQSITVVALSEEASSLVMILCTLSVLSCLKHSCHVMFLVVSRWLAVIDTQIESWLLQETPLDLKHFLLLMSHLLLKLLYQSIFLCL